MTRRPWTYPRTVAGCATVCTRHALLTTMLVLVVSTGCEGADRSVGDAAVEDSIGQQSQVQSTPTPASAPESTRPSSRPTAVASASPSGPADANSRRRTKVNYAFPIRPRAAASYERAHHDYPATDVFAPCGTTVVSPVDGIVEAIGRSDRWDPSVDAADTRGGRFVSIVGADGVRYYGSHLAGVDQRVRVGTSLRAGQRLGRVGRSGNARATPCHLHFGISPPTTPDDWKVRRGTVWPWRYLDAWRVGAPRSPARAVATGQRPRATNN